VDGILLGELLGKRLAHLVKVVKSILDDLRACCSAEEKACLGVLGGLWLALLERSLCTRIARFAINVSFSEYHCIRGKVIHTLVEAS
jgi:hypothetical protein